MDFDTSADKCCAKSDQDVWTREYLIETLHYELESFKDNNKRIYQEQAKHLLYRIPIYRPIPYFIVNKKDITKRSKEELSTYYEQSREDILKDAVGRIFENINERYFLQSVKRLLVVELRY